ncbi:MAG: alpha/beta fold hydrolase, partial [Ignavibacteria bacterium]|nr:alpha/beta fold hydrolase [Ignavibacteria bacterium]
MIRIVSRCIILFLWTGLTLSGQTRQDAFLFLPGNDSLDITFYIPSQPPPPGGYPALLFVHGFGLSKDWDTSNCATYARMGYISLCYSVRGHGRSSGLSTIMALQERQDLVQVINYLRVLPDVDSNAVGIIGGSQGGLHGLWAAVDSLPVKAISCDVIVPAWGSDMFMNGSVRTTFASLLNAFSVRYSAGRELMWELLRADDYDSLRAMFVPNRDVDTTALNSSMIPRMTFLKWQDHYFAAGNGIESFRRQQAAGKIYLGTGGHFSDFNSAENQFQFGQITRWFDYWLRGLPTGILDEPPITYASSSLPRDSTGDFSWSRQSLAGWPPQGVARVKMFLTPDTMLSSGPATRLDSFVVENRYTDSSYTFDDGFIEGFKGPSFDRALPRTAVRFRSEPFATELEWVGAPAMELSVRSDSPLFPLHALVFEEDSLGESHFINRITYTARHWQPGTRGIVWAGGIPHAHRFSVGSHVVVEFTNIDQVHRAVFANIPFVLPAFRDCGVTVFVGDAQPSYVEFPFIGTPSALGIPERLPLTVTLYQNVPNPFNPLTLITFDLSRPADVSIEVFD